MMWNNNDICSGCNNPLLKNEDIVVCPVCGTPQHRECWNKNGACVNEHLHSEGFVWTSAGIKEEEPEVPAEQKAEPELPPVFNFGIPNTQAKKSENYDPYGEEPHRQDPIPQFIYNTAIPPEALIDGIPASELAQVVQYKVPRYISRFFRIDQTNMKFGWNWGVCLIALIMSIFYPPISLFYPALWFFYRKMPKIGVLVLAGALFFSIATLDARDARIMNGMLEVYREAIDNPTEFNPSAMQDKINKVFDEAGPEENESRENFLNILAHLAVFGLSGFADYLYLGDIKKRIYKARKTAADGGMYRRLLYEKGGTSLGLVLLAAVAYFILQVIATKLTISILG